MKNLKSIIWIVLISISSTFAQDSLKNIVTTFGRIEIKVPADFATVSFKVITEGSSLRDAVEKAKTKVGLVTQDLYNLGLSENNISTSRFHTGENYGGKSFFSSKNDYKTVINTYLKIDSLNTLENILLTISDHKVDEISNITFNLKNPEKHKMEALDKAMNKAKEKAILLAEIMGSKTEKPLMITEIKSNRNINIRGGRSRAYPNPFNAAYVIDGVDLSGGQSIFSESISVTAEIELQVLIR